MKRRDFGKTLVGGALGLGVAGLEHAGAKSAAAATTTAAPRKKALMHVAEDHFDRFTEEDFQYMLRHGVKHFEAEVRKCSEEGAWDLDEMKRMRDLADKHGCTLEMLPLKKMKVGKGNGKGWRPPNIYLGKSPERDREIEIIAGNIRKAAAIGVPAVRYHWKLVEDYRNGHVAGEGGNSFLSWNLESNWKELPEGPAGRIPLEAFWERVHYFLERIMPVAEECKVRLACHPPDPPLPPGYRGVDTWDYNMFEGLKKYASLVDSPYFGFLLCVGTLGEGLTDPANDEVCDIVRHFGERKKIFMVHLRNIKGCRDHFSEWYPQDGTMDFYKVMKVLREVDYPGAILPDHMPSIPDHPDDPQRKQAYAFGFGYIQALIQAVNEGA